MDRPQPQPATGSEQDDAEPANGIAVDDPERVAVRVGRQPSREQPPKAARTQRLPRSSRTPGLRFPPTKNAAPTMIKSTTVSAMSAGWEKNAANPPQPDTARPR
jgi:hypothetical protein